MWYNLAVSFKSIYPTKSFSPMHLDVSTMISVATWITMAKKQWDNSQIYQ